MTRTFYFACAFAAGILCGAATMALAQATTTNAIVLSDLWPGAQASVVGVVGAVMSGLMAWVANMLKTRLGVTLDDSLRNALQTATTNAAGLVLNQVGNELRGVKLDIGQVGNDVIKYVLENVPQATAHFKLDSERVAQMILAKVPQVANTAAAPPPLPTK